MLRAESQRRIKAARKKKWAEYRQAKETALVTNATSANWRHSVNSFEMTPGERGFAASHPTMNGIRKHYGVSGGLLACALDPVPQA